MDDITTFRGEGPALTVFVVAQLVRDWLTFCNQNTDRQARTAALRVIEATLYGRAPGYSYSNFWCPEGVGAHITNLTGYSSRPNHAGAVVLVLLRLWDKLCELEPVADWQTEGYRLINEAVSLLTGGAWDYRHLMAPPPAAPTPPAT